MLNALFTYTLYYKSLATFTEKRRFIQGSQLMVLLRLVKSQINQGWKQSLETYLWNVDIHTPFHLLLTSFVN